MVILDTDHLSFLIWQDSLQAKRLEQRLETLDDLSISATVVSFEEFVRGWMSVIARAKDLKKQIDAYRRLNRHRRLYCSVKVLDFDELAATQFQRLKKTVRRVATMDLKIAAIALANNATLLTRNTKDFSQIPNLRIEDWTKE